MLTKWSVMLVVCFGIIPSTAMADGLGIEGLFSHVQGVDIFGQLGALTQTRSLATSDFLLPSPAGLRGAGFELLLDLSPADTSKLFHAVTQTVNAKSKVRRPWAFELGLGYEYKTGFISRDSSFDLRGSVRNIPEVSAYFTEPSRHSSEAADDRDRAPWYGFYRYLGLTTGLLQLSNVKAYDSVGRQYAVEGTTFELGASLGLFHPVGQVQQVGWFVEAGYVDRTFSSLNWTLPPGVPLNSRWPRSLNLSGVTVSIGFQFMTQPTPSKPN